MKSSKMVSSYSAILFVFCLALLFITVPSNACKDMQIMSNRTSFDLTLSTTVNPTIVVRADTIDEGCNFFITVDYGDSGSFSSRALRASSVKWPIQFFGDAAGTKVLKRFPDITNMSDVISGTLTKGSYDRQVSVSYWGVLDMSNLWLPAGDYQDRFSFTLYEGSPFGAYYKEDVDSVSYWYQASRRADISIVPTGGSFNLNDAAETLNFGTLSAGVTRSADAIVKYNSGYILRASSANNGQLKHEMLSQFISYSIKFNGVTFSLADTSSSPITIFQKEGQSPASGRIIPMSVTIGSVAGKQSGAYKDTVTLTVQSSD